MKSLLSILALFSIIPLPSSAEVRRPASVSTMLTSELADFDKQPVEVQTLIRSALGLTEQKLTYVFGSHDPRRGGMDCWQCSEIAADANGAAATTYAQASQYGRTIG